MSTNTVRIAPEVQAFADVFRGICDSPMFAGARFGFDARDLSTGAPIFQHNAYDVFPGASTTKIATAVYALALLGPDFRFRTKLVRVGAVDEFGTLWGDLILVASGDPNLSNRVTPQDTLDFENLDHSGGGPKARLIRRDPLQVVRAFAQGVCDAGIRRITGTVLVDLHLFPEGDREIGTGTTVSPVSVNDNQIDVQVVGSSEPGGAVTYQLFPQSGYVHFINRAVTREKTSELTLRFSKEQIAPNGTWCVVISGGVPAGSTSVVPFAVESPSRFARTLLVETLASLGVIVEGGLIGSSVTANQTSTDAIVVREHVSPPLVEATKVMLKVSQNLHAEMLISAIGSLFRGIRGEDAPRAGHACCVDLLSQWGLDTTGIFQGDGCGAYSYFSPDFMSRLLVRAAASGIYEALLFGLPVMGRDGTLWDIQEYSPAAGHIMAKTGTFGLEDPLHWKFLFACKGLAGYVIAKSGRRIAFTLYLSNFMCLHPLRVSPGQVLGEIASAVYENF